MTLQLPQACLVTRRRMVRTARQLETKYCDHDDCHCGNHYFSLERQCEEGVSDAHAGGGAILPQSIVYSRESMASLRLMSDYSWSKQIIEHEKAEKARKSKTTN